MVSNNMVRIPFLGSVLDARFFEQRSSDLLIQIFPPIDAWSSSQEVPDFAEE